MSKIKQSENSSTEIASTFAFGEHWDQLPEYVGYIPEQYPDWETLKNQFYASQKYSHERPLPINIKKGNTIVAVNIFGFRLLDKKVALCKTVSPKRCIAIAW
ncbi:MAG: hypothetical protein WCL02_08090 [bacterium]